MSKAPPPFLQLAAVGKIDDANAVSEVAIRRVQKELEGAGEASEFLAVQAEMLAKNTEFAGLEFVTAAAARGSIACYDRETKTLSIDNSRLSCPLSQTFSHEITHAVDHLLDCQSEEDLTTVIADLAQDEIADLMRRTSRLLPKAMQAEYRRQVKAGGDLRTNFIQETAAYIMEGVFYDIQAGHGVKDTLTRYHEKLASTGVRRESKASKIVQQTAAIAMHNIVNSMIVHIETAAKEGVEISSSRKALYTNLTTIRDNIQPQYNAYSIAAAATTRRTRTTDRAAVSAPTTSAADAGAGAGAGAGASEGGAGNSGAGPSAARKRMKPANKELARKGKKLLYDALTATTHTASRMRAGLIARQTQHQRSSVGKKVTPAAKPKRSDERGL